jgi:hypothetical protein
MIPDLSVLVIAGLDPAIHQAQPLDDRIKPGHDEEKN